MFGSINEARAPQAIEALKQIGLTIDLPARKQLTTAEPKAAPKSVRRFLNRITVLTPDDVDLKALETTASQKARELRQLLLRNSFTVAKARKELGVASIQTIHNWVRRKKILALPDRHRLMLPKWQFDADTRKGVVDGLELVLKEMNGSPFAIAYWLTARNRHLRNKTPIELLRQGNVVAVVEEARGLGLSQ